MSDTKRPRVLVVSLQKSGTHLICELMNNLGYRVYGLVVRDKPPEFSPRELRLAARSVLTKREQVVLSAKRLFGRSEAMERRAIHLLLIAWGERLGEPWYSRHGAGAVHALYSRRNLTRLSALPVSSAISNICIVKHELPLHRTDGHFLRQWSLTGEPAIVFMYRDPRDVLCSFVRYLTGDTGRGLHGGFAEYYIYQAILKALRNHDERLSYCIKDPNFPGHQDFVESLWLMNHPQVCSIRYEDLVGTRGEGTTESQEHAVAKVLRHLNLDLDPRECARGIYRTDSFTFSKGVVDSWKSLFKPHHHEEFERQFPGILESYGYVSEVPNENDSGV